VTENYYREATPEELVAASDTAGGGPAGTEAAEALAAEGRTLRGATIILGPEAGAHEKLHELGHVEQGLQDPDQAILDANVALAAETLEDYQKSDSERYAEEFADAARRKDDPIKNEPLLADPANQAASRNRSCSVGSLNLVHRTSVLPGY
jgi:hypothetical protein